MKNEEKAPILLYKIMSSNDLINRANISSLNNITKNHLNNKIKQKLNPIKNKIKKFSRKISKNIKKILNTSDIITRAKKSSFDLKDILFELDKDHKNNINKFKNLRKITNDNQYILSNFIKKEKEEEESIKSTVKEEMSRHKMHKLLSDNILLMAKRKEIFSYYLIKNKYQSINDEKKIRYIDKIREMLEIKQIQSNDSLDEKEKKVKLQNIKFYVNQEKRIKKEMQENYNKLTQRLKQENDLSLKSIKETNDTLRSIKLNKSYLDEDIKLKYEHIPSIILKNRNNSKKKKILNKIKELDNNISMTLRPNRKKSLINLKRFILSKSTFKPKLISIKKNNNNNKNISLDNQSISNNYSSIILDDDNLNKSRINSVYEEIKHNNILLKKDKDFMKAYFENKKMKLSNKNRQAVTIMSNSLSRINEIDITKKLKRIHGMHIPEKYVKFFDKIETVNKNSNKMKFKIFDSLCKVRMDD